MRLNKLHVLSILGFETADSSLWNIKSHFSICLFIDVGEKTVYEKFPSPNIYKNMMYALTYV